MNTMRMETPVNNLINLYVSEAMLDSEVFPEFWEKIKESGYITKSDAKAMWTEMVEDQAYRNGELG